MSDTTNRASDITVADVMLANAATVSTHATMQQAADTLVRSKQHGACVVDEFGYCVGVISSWDFVRLEQQRASICDMGKLGTVHELIREHADSAYSLDSSDYDGVRRHMSSFVQTIERSASAQQAAQTMCDAGIHHLVVLDDNNRPLGLVTSIDLIRLMNPPGGRV